jgi:hypothetical protein
MERWYVIFPESLQILGRMPDAARDATIRFVGPH